MPESEELSSRLTASINPNGECCGIRSLRCIARPRDVRGYGKGVTRRLQRLIRNWIQVKDSHILVIGSVNPWIEVILLSEGAKNITTLDYNPYSSDHPKINIITPEEISEHISDGKILTFDAMISFSSLEHSGLGR